MKKIIIILVFLMIATIGVFGFIILSDLKEVQETREKDTDETASSVDIEEMRESLGGSVTEEEMESFSDKGLNPFGHVKTIQELTDMDFQEYIHGMSHQKVKAEQKWGFYQINAERINWLQKGLQNSSLIYDDVYRSILDRWAEGDFSSADVDHNSIWELQNGTIGKATGILSPEEEKAYIESQK